MPLLIDARMYNTSAGRRQRWRAGIIRPDHAEWPRHQRPIADDRPVIVNCNGISRFRRSHTVATIRNDINSMPRRAATTSPERPQRDPGGRRPPCTFFLRKEPDEQEGSANSTSMRNRVHFPHPALARSQILDDR